MTPEALQRLKRLKQSAEALQGVDAKDAAVVKFLESGRGPDDLLWALGLLEKGVAPGAADLKTELSQLNGAHENLKIDYETLTEDFERYRTLLIEVCNILSVNSLEKVVPKLKSLCGKTNEEPEVLSEKGEEKISYSKPDEDYEDEDRGEEDPEG